MEREKDATTRNANVRINYRHGFGMCLPNATAIWEVHMLERRERVSQQRRHDRLLPDDD